MIRLIAVRTFAISAQLLPASLICLSLSSSAGVHGVFVLFFFAGGADRSRHPTGSAEERGTDGAATWAGTGACWAAA